MMIRIQRIVLYLEQIVRRKLDMGLLSPEQQTQSSKTLLVTRILDATEAGERDPARLLMLAPMSAVGPKQTSLAAPHVSAFGGKADLAFCGANVCSNVCL